LLLREKDLLRNWHGIFAHSVTVMEWSPTVREKNTVAHRRIRKAWNWITPTVHHLGRFSLLTARDIIVFAVDFTVGLAY
jgi:hypothetical protein